MGVSFKFIQRGRKRSQQQHTVGGEAELRGSWVNRWILLPNERWRSHRRVVTYCDSGMAGKRGEGWGRQQVHRGQHVMEKNISTYLEESRVNLHLCTNSRA